MAFLAQYDPAFSTAPACAGEGSVEALTPNVNQNDADHIFQIREYELADGCLRIVITFGTDFDDSGIAPRYDMIGTDMRPVGNIPAFEIQRVQNTTLIRLKGIDHAWTTQSSNVISEVLNDEAVDAFAVRRSDGAIDVYIPVIGWPQATITNPATGQLIVDITKTGPERRLRTGSGIHLIGDSVFTAGGTLEFMGLARPFEATVGIEIRQAGEVVVDDSAMTTDWTEAWGLFRYRAVGLDAEQHVTVTITHDSGPETATLTFEYQSELDTFQPTDQQLVDQSDLEVTDALIDFAQGSVAFEELSFANKVILGLGNTELLTADRSDLASASAWIIQHAEFAESTGPFDILGPLRTEAGITQVNVGPRPHCAGPPLDFGLEWDQGRHLVIEPTGIDTCLMWYAIHLLLNDRGQIQAVTLDLFGPLRLQPTRGVSKRRSWSGGRELEHGRTTAGCVPNLKGSVSIGT